jgi:uncharacterized membrane protein
LTPDRSAALRGDARQPIVTQHNPDMTTSHEWTALIIAHTMAAVSALALGSLVLLRRKGTFSHRVMGWTWVALMATVALVSFGIQRDGYSWIHGLSVFALVMLVVGVRHARQHRARHHGKTMRGIFFGALVITGLFTLLPGRLIGQGLFSALGWQSPF